MLLMPLGAGWASGRGSRAPDREQPHGARAHQQQGIEVGVAAAQTPVQAGATYAAVNSRCEGAQPHSRVDGLARADSGEDRLICRAQRTVLDADHAAAGHQPGEDDDSAARREHRRPGRDAEVDATVAGCVRTGGRVEPAQDDGATGEWPTPSLARSESFSGRPGGRRTGRGDNSEQQPAGSQCGRAERSGQPAERAGPDGPVGPAAAEGSHRGLAGGRHPVPLPHASHRRSGHATCHLRHPPGRPGPILRARPPG